LELEQQAGLDPLEDRMKVGYIAACKDIINLTFLEEQESVDD
jgi:hypothetical protein